MSMFFDAQGQLLLDRFDGGLRAVTQDLKLILDELGRTHAAKVESTHFLLALAQIPGGFASALFREAGLGVSDLQAGLRACIRAEPLAVRPAHLSLDILDDSARQVIDSLERFLNKEASRQVGEADLLRAVLENLRNAHEITSRFYAVEFGRMV